MLTSIYVSDPGPRIGLEQPFYTTTEESGAVQLCVSITQMISGTVTATVTTFSQTAIGWFQQSVVSVELEIFKTFPFSWLWLYIIVYYFNILWWWLTKVCGGTANRRRCGWKSGVFPGCCGKQRSPSLQSSGNCYYISRCRWRIASVKHVYRYGAGSDKLSLLLCTDGQLIVTLQEPIMAVDEGKIQLPVCVDFLGSTLSNPIIVTLTTITGTAVGTAIVLAFKINYSYIYN